MRAVQYRWEGENFWITSHSGVPLISRESWRSLGTTTMTIEFTRHWMAGLQSAAALLRLAM